MRYLISFITILSLVTSCGESSEDSTETARVIDDDETNISVKENPDASSNSQIIEDTGEAKTNQSIPEANELDPREFTPAGNWQIGAGVSDLKLNSAKIVSNDDGRDHDFPACEHPIPAPGHLPPEAIKIDGAIDDWSVSSIVSIDKKGDSNSLENLDLRSFFWSADDESYYIAIELYSDWKTDNQELAYLNIFFNSFTIPEDNSAIPIASFSRGFAIINGGLYVLDDEVFNPAAQGKDQGEYDYEFAISGNIIELRINKKHILPQSETPFTIDVFTSDSVKQIDRMGPHIVGLVDDYACLVPIPNSDNQLTGYKMLVMRRSSEVDQSIAELSYRAMISSLPYAIYLTKNQINDWDTNNVISVDHMSTAGLYIPAIGHFIIDKPNNFANELGLPINHFFVTSHELLHSFNVSDYKLPSEWLREGHSNWFTLKIFQSYFGNGVFQKNLIFENNSFIKEEVEFASADHSISDTNWNNKPHTPLFYYRKAAALFSLLLARVDYDEFHDNLLLEAKKTSEFSDTDAFLTAYKGLPTYQGDNNDDIKSYWFDNGENYGIFSKDQFNDADRDGLFDYQETELGTDSMNFDSDQDGLSDNFEWTIGLEPNIGNSYDFLGNDNFLGDWEKNHPDKLISSQPNLGSSDHCDESTNIIRFGITQHEEKILIAIELGQKPLESAIEQLQIVIFINEPNNNPQVIIPFGSSYYLIKNEDNSLLRSNQLIAPFHSTTLEILLKSKWLNWDESPPLGTKFRIVTYLNNEQCDYTENLPSTLL